MKKLIFLKTQPLLAIVPALVILGACSDAPLVKEIASTENPVEVVQTLETDLKTGYEKQLNVLSPSNYKNAVTAWEGAKKDLNNKRPSKEILHEVALGRHYLGKSYEVAKLAATNIEEVVSARQQAITAGAATIAPKGLQDSDTLLTRVTSSLEKNETAPAEESRGSLQGQYLALELIAIKQNYLGHAREVVQQAVDEGAKEFSPRSLELAEKTIKDADAFIIANRHETGKLITRSAEALASAGHVLKITRAAKSGEKATSEELALQMEKEQNRVVDKQSQLTLERGAMASLKAENKMLMSEQAFNQLFDSAQSSFSKTEAEVYKQGGALKIRLIGLEFPNSKALLKTTNFPLLAKVQKVIKGFGKSSIVVEGYTDSQGDKETNTKLSLERALAVREYLIANNDINATDIKAKGFGYQKPAGTNMTIEGRAQNRRVDIIITPDEGHTVSE